MYFLIRKILFLFNAETVHNLSLKGLSFTNRLGLLQFFSKKRIDDPTTVMGIKFANKVGLAAGLDKNGAHIKALSHLGFGFIEVGTVTPVAQLGNQKPRLFRLHSDDAIINRMGFNNDGVDALLNKIKQCNKLTTLGVNIGKNKNTPLEKSSEDYLICLRKVYNFADYITINISSPNTPGLRDLQTGDTLTQLLALLKQEQKILSEKHQRYVPLVVKIAPDLDDKQIEHLATQLLNAKIDGVIATNTTNSRPATLSSSEAVETGGLSGKPIFELSTQVVQKLAKYLAGEIPIIAAGGIFSAEDAQKKIDAGASLVQVYSGFIYLGPKLIYQCAKQLT